MLEDVAHRGCRRSLPKNATSSDRGRIIKLAVVEIKVIVIALKGIFALAGLVVFRLNGHASNHALPNASRSNEPSDEALRHSSAQAELVGAGRARAPIPFVRWQNPAGCRQGRDGRLSSPRRRVRSRRSRRSTRPRYDDAQRSRTATRVWSRFCFRR